MSTYKFLEHKYLKQIFHDAVLNNNANDYMAIYFLLTKSYQNAECYWVNRKTLETFLEFDNNTSVLFDNWYYIKSKNFNGIKSHRIYLHPQGKYIPVIAKVFMKKCRERSVQFWFKFKFSYASSDSMVFYPTDEQFPIFNEIIDEIFYECPDIKQTCMEPPISTLEYNPKMGYGKEYENSNTSWTENISIKIRKCANIILCKMISNLDFSKYNPNYLVEKLADAYIIDIEEYISNLKSQPIKIDRNVIIKNFKLILPNLILLIKSFDKYKDCIADNEVFTHILLDGKYTIIRPTFIVEVAKIFINDIISLYGEENILDKLANFIEINLDNIDLINKDIKKLLENK